jgi:hypothetical protein
MEPVRENQTLSEENTLRGPEVARNTSVASDFPNKFFLFQYITMLVSGLVLLALLSFTGFALLNHWLGEPSLASIFSGFEYYAYIYLLVSLVLFGALHAWMRMRVGAVVEDDQPSAVRVFRAIFLTVLILTMVGSVGTMLYIGVDMLLGTGDYSAKSAWLIILDSLQVILWAALLWWYFRQPRAAAVVYTAGVAIVVGVMAVLLVAFPIFSKRDAVIDSRTSADLSSIETAVSAYVDKNDKLPAALSDVTLGDKVKSRVGNYEYQITQATQPDIKPTSPEADYLNSLEDYALFAQAGILQYKLCATFKTDTTTKENDGNLLMSYFSSGMAQHPSGRHCFDKKAYSGGSDRPVASPSQEALDAVLNSDSL